MIEIPEGFIAHDGGECPVAGNAVIKPIYRGPADLEKGVIDWLRMKSNANHDCGFGREAVALADAADALERGEHKETDNG